MMAASVIFVTQTGSLPYRRLAVGGLSNFDSVCGLPIRDTADCQSALQLRAVEAEYFPSLRAPQFLVIFAHQLGIIVGDRIAIERHEAVRIFLPREFLLQPDAH